jgi:hypothetical protein
MASTTMSQVRPRTVAIAVLGMLAAGVIVASVMPPTQPEVQVATLTDRDVEIIEYVLRETPDSPDERIYFLTVTPKGDWGERGSWQALPADFHARVADLSPHYLPASNAWLSRNCVLQRGTNAEAWMRWITVTRWISASEVEVDEGVWRCPLGGGGRTTVYEKRDGKWRMKSAGSLRFWAS